jgi:regulator of cell morphogenesis and NO signaling
MTATANQTVSPNKTVREFALEIPNATRVFEQLGIDYCCGGQKPLSEACASSRVSLNDVIEKLETARHQTATEIAPDRWQIATLPELISHIVRTHHAYVTQEVPRLQKLLAKVYSVHGQKHPELLKIQEKFLELSGELGSHLMKEEQILFPYIVQVERGESPQSCFGTVENPIRMMMFEHDNAGEALRTLRAESHDYTAPADACISYKTLYEALQAFEADLHQHIHLENNILFPRAVAME